MQTTVGQLLINEALPEEMRDYHRVIDKKGLKPLFTELADKYPDKYAEINQRLHTLSADAVTGHGDSTSLTLDSLRTPLNVERARKELQKKIDEVLDGAGTQKQKNEKIIALVSASVDPITKQNYEEALAENNPLAIQVSSGSRGNPAGLRSLTAGDFIFTDHKNRPIPVPALRSFSEGLDPVQYWAGAYTARKGTIATKFATPKSGFLGKQLNAAVHRLIVTEKDCGTPNGIVVDANDPDNEGALLAIKTANLDRDTILDPRNMRKLKGQLVVRSPMTCQAEHGVCQKCAGIRERGGFSPIGDNIGLAAAQAISEPIGQGQLNVKHGGGKLAKGDEGKIGIDLINQIVQVPKTFAGAAAISTVDGRIERVENAPQGGQYVTVAGTEHWVPADASLTVKKGDTVEAGDVLSSGIPNPAEITRYKGIGEGRRYFMDMFRKTLEDNSFKAHRRNIELLSRGLINHVRITDLDGPADTLPDDVTEYDDLVRGWKPRYGAKPVAPKRALGLYLEQPALHYSIGTRVTPRVSKNLETHGIKTVMAHADEPSFVPEMTRAMETLSHSSDWMVRLGGFHLKKALTESVHRGRESKEHSTSFIPPLAKGVEFGKPKDSIGY